MDNSNNHIANNIFTNIKHIKLKKLIICLVLILLLSIFLSVGIGPVSISNELTWKIILYKIPFLSQLIDHNWTLLQENIVWKLRLPRVLLGAIVGASLAVTGVSMQALVRNKLADPFILGVSSGAATFATLGILFGTFSFLGLYSLSISAFIGAFVTITLVYVISRVHGRINITQLLLSGVVISMIMDGITKIITLSAPNALGIHNAEFWMAGSLAGAKWSYLTLPFLVMVICLVTLLLNYRTLNALLLGDEVATTLGVNVSLMQKLLVLISSLLSGVCIAVSGSIGFIGLMCPHFARLLVGGDHRKVLPIAGLLGAIIVIWADVVARCIIAPEELPLGILTAVVGGPFFIILLKKTRR